ncbi:MAG: class E sortase [Candidatus Doudnabacteria bacterium]|nr:class E sortase [Candidatus Doudnabacteria bacterium]
MPSQSHLIYRLFAVFGLIVFAILISPKAVQVEPPIKSEAEAVQKPQASPVGQVLFIPKINVWVPVNYIDSTSEIEIQKSLLNGVVHVFGTPLPGEVGNAYLVGHASNYAWSKNPYDSVFAHLNVLKIGDNITVIDYSGQTNFEVFSTYLAAPDNASNISQDTKGRRLLTLQAIYTVGSEEKRFTAVAELAK